MPALSSTAESDFSCSSAVNTGLRTSRSRSALSFEQRVETVEIGPHGVDGMLFERKLEQCGRIAAGHAGNDQAFACHVDTLVKQFRRRGAVAIRRRKPLKFKWDFEFPDGAREPP